MIPALLLKAGEDERLTRLIEEARDYAGLYLLSKKRQKGCDGMGETAMVKEEFAAALYRLVSYGKEMGYLTVGLSYELDASAELLSTTG